MAQAQLPAQGAPPPGQTPTPAPQPATPVVVTQVQIVARAEQHMYKREGAACLAALNEVTGEWAEVLVPRVKGPRGNCEMLVGTATKGRNCSKRPT